ncbi:MAG: hypothetical protein M3R60_17250 [Pseudomonadota bacterium]|nr:hypothetical protein [Pseudomonadota bacterium]
MGLLQGLFKRKPKIACQAHVTRRAAAVIDRVIYDVGIETLVGGTFTLDKRFRLQFIGVPARRWRGVIATVQVSEVAESDLFRELNTRSPVDMAEVKQHSACLAQALVRELRFRSKAFRSLPAEA